MSSDDNPTNAELPEDWLRELHSKAQRTAGDPLSDAETELVARFVAGRLDEHDAEYVAVRAAGEWTWEHAVSAATLSQATDPVEVAEQIGGSRRETIRFESTPTLAADDLVRGEQRWGAGLVRLLESPLRSDWAIELTVDDDHRDEYAETLGLIRFGDEPEPIAVLPGRSPVFTGLSGEKLSAGFSAELEFVRFADLAAEHVEPLRRSRRNLRSPSALAAYAEAVSIAERA